MARQRIGYIRVSTLDQNPERQLEDISVDRTFVDKASGKDVHRPELEALIDFIRSGDTLVVHSVLLQSESESGGLYSLELSLCSFDNATPTLINQ